MGIGAVGNCANINFCSGYTLQVRHMANAQCFTGLFTAIRQLVGG